MLQRPYTVAPAAAQDPIITDYNLAYSKRDPAERAILAARLHLGQLQLVSPRITQAAALTNVSRSFVHFAIAVLKSNDPDLLCALEVGRLRLPEAAALARHPKTLTEIFIASTAAERMELGRAAGVDAVFDSVIAPLI